MQEELAEEKKTLKISSVVLVLPSSFPLGKDGEWRTEGSVGDAMATVSEGFSGVIVTTLGFCCKCGTDLKIWPLLASSPLSWLKPGSGFRWPLPTASQLALG